ncbi:MAG: dihydrolipoyl dehydrogenase [Acidimicrobiaceae bacterium]|nr:dihydrolipoyl dehydrogenase [Acidimicrobiaceae bacterium]
MSQEPKHFDLIVIGGGPGGYASALYGAAAGMNVALVEMAKIGGTCLHVGCIPAKELLETASVLRTVREAEEFGVISSEPTLNLSKTMERKQGVINQLTKGVESLLERRKVNVFNGIGSLMPDREVKIQGIDNSEIMINGDHVILASGSKPRTIPGFEIDGHRILTSDELLSLDEVPESVAIIGGGAIGVEFASALNDFGSSVTIVEALPDILAGCDKDLSKAVSRSFKKRGINILTDSTVKGHTKKEDMVALHLEGEDINVEKVVISIGRRPFADLLGLSETSITVDTGGFIPVDSFCRTDEEDVYAIGDLINTPQLAHVAFAEAIMVIKDICGEDATPVDYDKVPWAIYCHPEVAFAGLTESKAKESGYEIEVSKHRFTGNGRAMIVGETEGLVKVIAEKSHNGRSGQILGVHMVGPWVTEQLGQGYLAINWEATVDEVAEFIQPHPTMSELFGETVLALTGRALHG